MRLRNSKGKTVRRQVNWVKVLRQIRRARGDLQPLAQQEVALIVGASQSLIGELERGLNINRQPRADVAIALLDLRDRRAHLAKRRKP